MLELGYLNDEHYADVLFKHLRDDKKMSSSFIKQEMRKRGISAEIIDNLFEENEVDNVSSVCELILTKYARKLNQEVGRDKVFAALQRKGFKYSDIKQAFYLIENDEYQQ